MRYYTSDLHFGCEAIFEREKRNLYFSGLREMGEKLVDNINKRCDKDDTLYILGDVACADYDPTPELIRIKPHMVLIAGNHDAKWLKHRHFVKYFDKVLEIGHVHEFGTRITLFHYPMCEWDGAMKGHWHFYGHVHGMNMGYGRLMDQIPHACNVGVDVNDFMPMTAGELISKKILQLRDAGYNVDDDIDRRLAFPSLDFNGKDETGRSLNDHIKGI